VLNVNPPLFPPGALPVDSVKLPELPAVPELAVTNVMLPLLYAPLYPEYRLIEPPVAAPPEVASVVPAIN